MTRAEFIKGIFGLAFAASVAIRGAAQETTAGKLCKRVPLVIRIPSYTTGELWSMADKGIRSGFDPAGGPSTTVKFEIPAETDEPTDVSTDSYMAERKA